MLGCSGCSPAASSWTVTSPSFPRSVAVITDSSACLPAAEVERLGIGVVPIVLVWNGQELRDGRDISPAEFWRRLATERELPSTSTMAPGDYLAAFEPAAEWAQAAVCVCIPRSLSTMAEAAAVAGRAMAEKMPVHVLEAGGAGMAAGFPAIHAARAASDGASIDDVVRTAERVASHSAIVAVLDSLAYVARSGRVPGVVARIADAVPSTFVLRLEDGNVGVRARFGSRQRAVQGLVKQLAKDVRNAAYVGVAVHHGADEAEAHELAEQVRRDIRPDDLFVTSFTPVMGAHVGPGIIGLGYCALPA